MNHEEKDNGGRRASILVAEDGPALRRLVVSMLQERGYRVFDAENGDAAVELFRWALADEEAGEMPENLEVLSPEAARRALYELRMHQVELEMQNEELRRTEQELEHSRARYFDLYDLAPVGYFALSEQGLILEANLTAARLLGVERGALVNQPLSRFVLREDQDIYYLRRKALLESGAHRRGSCECIRRMSRRSGCGWTQTRRGTLTELPYGAP